METLSRPNIIESGYACYLLAQGLAYISGKGEENVYLTNAEFPNIRYCVKWYPRH